MSGQRRFSLHAFASTPVTWARVDPGIAVLPMSGVQASSIWLQRRESGVECGVCGHGRSCRESSIPPHSCRNRGEAQTCAWCLHLARLTTDRQNIQRLEGGVRGLGGLNSLLVNVKRREARAARDEVLTEREACASRHLHGAAWRACPSRTRKLQHSSPTRCHWRLTALHLRVDGLPQTVWRPAESIAACLAAASVCSCGCGGRGRGPNSTSLHHRL